MIKQLMLSLGFLMLSGCGGIQVPTQEQQCASLRRNVTAAQTGFSGLKNGPYVDRSGNREFRVEPALDSWERCRIIENPDKRRSTLRCDTSFPRGAFQTALDQHKYLIDSIRQCVVFGSENSTYDRSSGDAARETTFQLVQSRNELYLVEIQAELVLYSTSSGGGSREYLSIKATRSFLPSK